MKKCKFFKFFFVAVLIICLLSSSASAFISVLTGFPGTYIPYDDCGGVTPGGTALKDMWILPPDPLEGWVIEAFEWQFSGPNIYTDHGIDYRPEDERWSFTWGDPLNGTLYIDKYEAYDKHSGADCRHGAHLSVSYYRDPSDPWYLDWAQVFIASYDKHGVPAGTPIADPFYNDGTDDAPFYFSNLDDPLDFYDGWQPDADLIFGDTPGASHLEVNPFSVSLSLNLYLTSIDPLDPYHVILHDGISWGYDGVCVPEPGTVCLLGLGGFALLRKRRL
ncbi:MAG: PEP-CTERM sorting domain-containing protein [Sedimentisphaerales bacterium]|nr:PEP-CTERM sorting domain-containing protein [Sedimentisphaerales bacterium]